MFSKLRRNHSDLVSSIEQQGPLRGMPALKKIRSNRRKEKFSLDISPNNSISDSSDQYKQDLEKPTLDNSTEGQMLYTVKKQRQAHRDSDLDGSMLDLTPRERESILCLEEALVDFDETHLPRFDHDDESVFYEHSRSFSNCSVIDLVGGDALSPSEPNYPSIQESYEAFSQLNCAQQQPYSISEATRPSEPVYSVVKRNLK